MVITRNLNKILICSKKNVYLKNGTQMDQISNYGVELHSGSFTRHYLQTKKEEQ